MTSSPRPTLRVERGLLRSGVIVLGCIDEAGRGALAGPVTVAVVTVTAQTRPAPNGVQDSKLLTPAARAALVPEVHKWAHGYGVGHADAEEIDRVGIVAAMALAAQRALAGLPTQPDAILLDGSHDYLTNFGQLPLFDVGPTSPPLPPVKTRVRADRDCAGVAAASVLAKTARDDIMVALAPDYPRYSWDVNKGYGTPAHLEALSRLGPSREHRRSWNLPGPA